MGAGVLDRLLDTMLRRILRRGELTVTYPDGTVRRYGGGAEPPAPEGSNRAVTPPAPAVAVRIHDEATLRSILRDPDLCVAEAYMDGRMTIEGDDLVGFLTLALANRSEQPAGWAVWRLVPVRSAMKRITELNPASRSAKNVEHHYDLSGALYELFLDRDRQYSCAYWPRADMTLDEAQEAKKHHIARKLRIEPGMSVLDIGCGWGGLAITLARDYGARVTGVTLSREQLAYGKARVEAEGLADRIDLQLIDYRAVKGQFDRIVSVGMFEHVGAPHYREYFRVVRERLSEDGVALIHTIGLSGPPSPTSSFIQKYIFPGGALPSLSQISTACERERVVITDVEVLRRHYAETLKAWRERFEARADEARALYDDRFVRMWRYYLIASEMSFRLDGLVVFQVQLARRFDALPITRNYMTDPPGDEAPDQNGRTTLPE